MRGVKFPKKIRVLAFVSGLAIVGISLMKNAMELEDAEQAYYSQWWRWGYDDQPPLYTWLQIGVNKILGISKMSFSVLRGVLFASLFYALYLFAISVKKNATQALSVVLALVLLPTYIDFTFRRLSHTTLLCVMVVLTYYLVQQLIKRKSVLNYVMLGFAIGVGLLTKYNYALVLAAFSAALFLNSELRKVVLHRNFGLTVLVSLLLLVPHINWLFSDAGYLEELQVSLTNKAKTDATTGIPLLTPLLSFVFTIVKLAWPLMLVVLFWVFKKQVKFTKKEKVQPWLWHVGFAQILILLTVFVCLNVQKVEARWLLPLAIPFLALFSNTISNKLLVKWNRIGFVLFICILGLQTIRTPLEKAFEISSSVHYGFEEISDKLRTSYSNENWVLPNVTYAGSIRLLNSNRSIYSLDDFSLPDNKIDKSNSVFVVKEKNEIPMKAFLKDSIVGFGKNKENLYFYQLGH